MPHRTATDDCEKFDRSARPSARSMPDDLRAPSGGTTESPNGRRDLRGGVYQQKPVATPDSANQPISGRRNSRVRRLDSRGSANK
jgi:hypothetical protein